MSQLSIAVSPALIDQIKTVDGVYRVSSRDVAATFGKEHKHVLEAIARLDCSPEFSRSNFRPSEYLDLRGKLQPEVLMTRDGTMFVTMGFSGKEPARIKEAYIAAFNEMERRLTAPVDELDVVTALVAAMRAQKAQLALVVAAVDDSTLNTSQIILLERAMVVRRDDIGGTHKVLGNMKAALKKAFLPHGCRTGMTWKEISQRSFDAALELIETYR